MSSSPVAEPSTPLSSPPSATSPPSPALHTSRYQTSTPSYIGKKPHQPPLSVVLPSTSPATPPLHGDLTVTPPPRSPGGVCSPASVSADAIHHPPDGTSSDKSSEAAVGVSASPSAALSRKESYKAQRQHYRREKKRAASALLHSIEDPSVIVLADWLKVRGSLKSWTKLWCVLKPGLLLLYKSPKAKSSHWVGTVLLTSCQVIERPSKKDGFCFKLYHPLEQSIWAPRGPHNETIGAVVQPLPTAHLIFRAPSQAAGHCWLDGLELALRCSNAMLRCSRSRAEQCQPDAPSVEPHISNEELEKHFNEHELAGAASDTDSTPEMGERMPRKSTLAKQAISRIEDTYVEDPDRDVGQAGELVEEVAEENKSLLWFLMKQVRPGMDLSKVVLPTFILEPRSFLDKLADTYYHADLLGEISTIEDPYSRFKAVLRFYLTGLYKKPKGLKKPYNPVLGETFRCCWKHPKTDTYTFYVSEQVSHHPPVSAFYVSNRKEGFVIEGSLLARSKFYGNSTSALLEGLARIYLLKWGETYITTAPYAHCKGIVIGTLSMELGGKVQLKCVQTGYSADLDFKLRSFLGGSEQTNMVTGRIKKGKDTLATLEGYWDGRIDIKEKQTGVESNLVDVNTLKTQRLTRYLVRFDLQKNYESQKLWIKVSEAIAREDQVAATTEKTVIEEAQRARAKQQTERHVPRYFHKDEEPKFSDGLDDQGWSYNFGNKRPWVQEEVFEYEEDYVIQSVGAVDEAVAGPAPSETRSESDNHDAGKRTHKSKSIKKSLQAIDASLRAQTLAIEQLSRKLNERVHSQQRYSSADVDSSLVKTHLWAVIMGVIVALIAQLIFNKLLL